MTILIWAIIFGGCSALSAGWLLCSCSWNTRPYCLPTMAVTAFLFSFGSLYARMQRSMLMIFPSLWTLSIVHTLSFLPLLLITPAVGWLIGLLVQHFSFLRQDSANTWLLPLVLTFLSHMMLLCVSCGWPQGLLLLSVLFGICLFTVFLWVGAYHRFLIHALRQQKLASLYAEYENKLEKAILEQEPNEQLRYLRHDIINYMQTILTAQGRKPHA